MAVLCIAYSNPLLSRERKLLPSWSSPFEVLGNDTSILGCPVRYWEKGTGAGKGVEGVQGVGGWGGA